MVLVGEDNKTEFLDPILLALTPAPGEPCSQLISLHLSCRQDASNGQSIVSPEALGSFLACRIREEQRPCGLHLRNLGLDDNHCKVMLEQTTKDDALRLKTGCLDLWGNPSIGQEGYQALLGLLNRKFNIFRIDVDDQSWKAKFDLVVHMNREFDRGLFLKDGAFPFKAMQMNFLAQLTDRKSFSSLQKTCSRIYPNQWLNAIWYTLREDPSLMYT